MNRPLLSIIIPTKNRYFYLISCLNALREHFNTPLVEIIITDNSSPQKDISKEIKVFTNVKYYYHRHPISQVENFELALGKVTGVFVTMIGDDDGISKHALDLVQYMYENKISALNTRFARYYWPGIISKSRINEFSGNFFLDSYSYKVSDKNSFNEVKKCLRNGGTSIDGLPRIYYGIIKKDILDKVKKSSGKYFPGPSPDMASSLACALFLQNFKYLDAPIFIAGNSPKSAAGLGLSGRHIGEIKDNFQLPKNYHLKWSELVPKYWSGITIYAETILKTLEGCNFSYLEKELNFYKLYAYCYVFNSQYNDRNYFCVKKFSRRNNIFKTLLIIRFYQLLIWFNRLKSMINNISFRLIRLFGSDFRNSYSNIFNIEEASKKLDKHIGQNINYELFRK